MSRPMADDDNNKLTYQVNVALTRYHKEALDRYAADDRRKVGELARLIVTDWIVARLQEEGVPPPPPEKPRPMSP